MNNESWNMIALILVVVIFGSGAVIWGVNKIQGRDLSKPPQFDLSAYDTMPWPSPMEVFGDFDILDVVGATADKQAEEALVDQLATKINEVIDNPGVTKLLPHSIYFKTFFKATTAHGTRKNIDNFLMDFPDIAVVTVEDMAARDCFVAELPVSGRADVIDSMKRDAGVVSVEVSEFGAPLFDVCFVDVRYEDEVAGFFEKYPAVLLKSDEMFLSEYIVRVVYDADDASTAIDVEQLKKDYSDVVVVID